MASSYNRVILVGNLTRDPELRYIPSGTAVADIGIAVNDRIKKGDEWQDEVCFVTCTAWGRTAEIANEYGQKGSPVLIEGRLKMDSYEKDGQKRTTLKVTVDKLQLLGSKSDRQQSHSQAEPAHAAVADEADPFGDTTLPF